MKDSLDPGFASRLRASVVAIPEVAALSTQKQEILLEEIAGRLPWYEIAKDIKGQKRDRTGRRPNVDIAVVIFDCWGSWDAATGRETTIWEDNSLQSTPCKIARTVIQVCRGSAHPYGGSLHNQIARAKAYRRGQTTGP